jgi:phage terminase large subunit-like protein
VLALDEHRDLEGLADPDVLALAATEHRILVTFNVRDFAPLTQDWAASGRDHSGCVLVVGLDAGDIGAILSRLSALLDRPADWSNRVVFLSRSG